MEASEQGGKEGRKVEEVEKRLREREGGGGEAARRRRNDFYP
jgi:hypothetical protein